MSSPSSTGVERPAITTPGRPHSSSLSSVNTLRSTTTSSTLACSSSEMHSKLTKQMQARSNNQQRWQSWQAKQIECFQGAAMEAGKDAKSSKGFTSKRPHIHLDGISRSLRRLRGFGLGQSIRSFIGSGIDNIQNMLIRTCVEPYLKTYRFDDGSILSIPSDYVVTRL
ncbi:hypothetical protein Z517_03969 [Fonsecaea pedrosoi CBS 271.37]|uniref:Uncharacterized protein n=1 Tax=Fonsecaea pedrosoi CBS 271.37 TaxID=1442368 RepID=A0A0D2DT13_9EURO|nr:uncharacterized protein Z517_03969 [Fonsecaea pedrosoi CBS 271.37]KIW80946.1 hypothetical protein Z517_03969 [Fonsecaea pedrosoi CBS 271.37]